MHEGFKSLKNGTLNPTFRRIGLFNFPLFVSYQNKPNLMKLSTHKLSTLQVD